MAELTAGVDLGSVAAKAVILHAQERRVLGWAVLPTGWDHKKAFSQVLEAALAQAACPSEALQAVVCTGYGRITMKSECLIFSEIACHAKGAHFLFPGTSGLIDIGGQDSKAVRLDTAGDVADFMMNDKCAAGTGRFLQMTAALLGVSLDEFSTMAGQGSPASISSMCAVFAESEIVGLLARGMRPDDIAAGVVQSIARRTAALASRMNFTGECVFSGGLAASEPLRAALESCLGCTVHAPRSPQITGALGGAILAAETLA